MWVWMGIKRLNEHEGAGSYMYLGSYLSTAIQIQRLLIWAGK